MLDCPNAVKHINCMPLPLILLWPSPCEYRNSFPLNFSSLHTANFYFLMLRLWMAMAVYVAAPHVSLHICPS